MKVLDILRNYQLFQISILGKLDFCYSIYKNNLALVTGITRPKFNRIKKEFSQKNKAYFATVVPNIF